MSVSICGDVELSKVDSKSNFLFIILFELSKSILSATSHFPDGEIKEAVVDTLFFETDDPIKKKSIVRYILIRYWYFIDLCRCYNCYNLVLSDAIY